MRYIIVLLLFSQLLTAKHDNKCSVHEKFVKAYEYISRLKNVQLSKQEVVNYAMQIATPCHETMERFGNVYDITEKTDLSVKGSIILAVRIARDKDIKLDDLKSMFDFLINPEGPDLPYKTAMRYAEAFAKTGKHAASHLEDVFNFCIKTKTISKTREKCIDLAYQVAALEIPKDNIFEDAYTYFSTHKHLNFNSRKSIEMTMKVLKFGPESFEDFKLVYEYATKKRGINLTRDEALKVALRAINEAESKDGDEIEKDTGKSKKVKKVKLVNHLFRSVR
jgi:hypothetical protein